MMAGGLHVDPTNIQNMFEKHAKSNYLSNNEGYRESIKNKLQKKELLNVKKMK